MAMSLSLAEHLTDLSSRAGKAAVSSCAVAVQEGGDGGPARLSP